MTQQATISRFSLEVGDFIAFDIPSQDIDIDDSTIWMRITKVTKGHGFTVYSVCFPDGEPLRRTIFAQHVGRFKKASDFAIDNKDLDSMNQQWRALAYLTASHELFCTCPDCLRRCELGRETLELEQEQFERRAARLAA